MSKAKLVITAVTQGGMTAAEAATKYQVSKGWVSRLLARYRVVPLLSHAQLPHPGSVKNQPK